MQASPFGFVNLVASDRDLVVTSAGRHVCRLQPRGSGLAWYCDLDDGTPTGEDDPASCVRWVCPALRVGGSTGSKFPQLDVRRSGPRSDLGRLVKSFGRLAGRSSRGSSGDDVEGRFIYTDPAGILDGALRRRVEVWPSAKHGDGVVRPAELSSIARTGEGLVVESVSWWGSAPVLDHQIGLALEIAHRLTANR